MIIFCLQTTKITCKSSFTLCSVAGMYSTNMVWTARQLENKSNEYVNGIYFSKVSCSIGSTKFKSIVCCNESKVHCRLRPAGNQLNPCFAWALCDQYSSATITTLCTSDAVRIEYNGSQKWRQLQCRNNSVAWHFPFRHSWCTFTFTFFCSALNQWPVKFLRCGWRVPCLSN